MPSMPTPAMQVPLLDLKPQYRALKAEIDADAGTLRRPSMASSTKRGSVTVRWLDLDHDEGPIRQTDRLARYAEVAAESAAWALASENAKASPPSALPGLKTIAC